MKLFDRQVGTPYNLYVALFAVGLTLAGLPFVLYGPHPLGYDTGFYMRYVSGPFVSVPNTAVPGLDHTIIVPRLLLDLANALSYSPAFALYGTLACLFALIAVTIALFVRAINASRKAPLFAGVLVITSPVLYLAYYDVLLKNFLGLILLFLALTALHKRQLLPATLLLLAIVPTHQSTTILALLTLGTYILLRFVKRHTVYYEILLSGLVTAFYIYLHPHVAVKIAAPPVGVFLDPLAFLLLSLPLIILMVVDWQGVVRAFKNAESLVALTLVCVAFVVLRLPYAERILLPLGIILATLAGVAITNLWHRTSRWRILVVILALAHVGTLTWQVHHLQPLLPRSMVQIILGLDDYIPPGATVVTMPHLAPWVQGWTLAQVYAPGMFKDTTSAEAWDAYFAHNDPFFDTRFLARYPSPLYLVADSSSVQLLIPHNACVTSIAQYVYRYRCPSTPAPSLWY